MTSTIWLINDASAATPFVCGAAREALLWTSNSGWANFGCTMALGHRKRILVVGSGGAGKSTFARNLAVLTKLPLIHLDRLFWRPGWVPTGSEEWTERLARLSDEPAWIMDGNYADSLPVRVQRCDAIVFLDLPRMSCMGGIVRRRFAYRSRPRSDMAVGCPEQLDFGFLRWVWTFRQRVRPQVLRAIREAGDDVEVITVRSRREAESLLREVEARPARSSSQRRA